MKPEPNGLRERMQDFEGEVREATPEELASVRIEEHGELGPVLVRDDHEFQSEREARKREAGS